MEFLGLRVWLRVQGLGFRDPTPESNGKESERWNGAVLM